MGSQASLVLRCANCGRPAGFIFETAPFPPATRRRSSKRSRGSSLPRGLAARGGKAQRSDLGRAPREWPMDGAVRAGPGAEIATYNPVLFYSKDGTLWLYYKFGAAPHELERRADLQPG